MNLYEYEQAVMHAMALTEEAQGEWTPEVEAAWEAVGETPEDRIARYCEVRATQLALVQGLKGEVARLNERIKSATAFADRMPVYIERVMDAAGKTEVDAGTFNVKFAKVAPSIDPDTLREDLLPADYWVEKTSRTIDRRTLLADLKVGEVPGATLLTGRKRVTIK